MDFLTDLHANDQEENGHQPIVDEKVQRFAQAPFTQGQCQVRMPEGFIAMGRAAIGPDERGHGGGDQHDAADRFDMAEALERSQGAAGQDLR